MDFIKLNLINSKMLQESNLDQIKKIKEEIEEMEEAYKFCSNGDDLISEMFDVIQATVTIMTNLYTQKKIEFELIKHNEKIEEKIKTICKCSCGKISHEQPEKCENCEEETFCDDCMTYDNLGHKICFICR